WTAYAVWVSDSRRVSDTGKRWPVLYWCLTPEGCQTPANCSATQLRDVAYGAAVGGGGERGVSLQGLRHHALAVDRPPGLCAARLHGSPPLGQGFIGNRQMHLAVRDVDFDSVAVFDQADIAALGRFRRSVADNQARRPARKAAVGEKRAGLAQALGLQVRSRIEHFLHAGAALRAFVADDHDIARLHLVAQDAFNGVVLALEHARAAGKDPLRFVHACGLDDAAVGRQVAVQHGQAAILRVGVFFAADTARLAVEVQRQEGGVLAEGHRGGNAAGGRAIEVERIAASAAVDVPLFDGLAQRAAVHVAAGQVEQIRAGKLAQNAQDAAG